MLTACGGPAGHDDFQGTGSIAFSLRMVQTTAVASAAVGGVVQAASGVDCDEWGITSVEALVYDEHDTLIARGGPWACTRHAGVISGIKQGKNRTVVINLRDDSLSEDQAIRIQGERTPVTVIAGRTTDIGFVDLTPEEIFEAQDDGASVSSSGTVYVLDTGHDSVLWNDSGEKLRVNTNPVVAPRHGTVTLKTNGTFRYDHDGTGTSDTFTYEVRDRFNRSQTAQVRIAILPPNQSPVLDQAGVSPDTGTSATTPFTYSVHYLDPDGITAPKTASVYIDNDRTPHPMTLSSGTAVDGTYTFTRQAAFTSGTHTYYFIFDDGNGGSARTPKSLDDTYSGPQISDQVLKDGAVTPDRGFSETLFTYRVHYSDIEGRSPPQHTVSIDDQPYAMTLESGNAWDGVYVFQTDGLSPGIHTYAFIFADEHGEAVRLPSEGAYTNPTVAVSLEGLFVAPAPKGRDANAGTAIAPFATIQHAVATAKGTPEKPVTIHIAAGTYYENISVDAWESLQGGWRNDFTGRWHFVADGIDPAVEYETIIDGGLIGRCLNIAGQDGVTIDGLTIRHGKADYHGGGILIENCSPIIKHCQVSDNTTAYYGGGIACKLGNPTISACLISANAATGSDTSYGGGMYNEQAHPVIINCTFAWNYAGCPMSSGGGMFNHASHPVIRNCFFLANRTGGDNSFGAGIYNASSDPVITNTIFAGNLAAGNNISKGGGVFNEASSPVITNCTFTRNAAAFTSKDYSMAGAVYNNASSAPTITNTILWSDSAGVGTEIYNEDGSGVLISYCDIDQEPYGNDTINHNIRLNPLLTDPESDWHLLPGSPCLDAGTNTAGALPDTDFEGDSRVINGVVDIGADEYR